MHRSRYKSSRQKSCQQCSNAKARCDWEGSATCARCTRRGLQCIPPSTIPDEQFHTISETSQTRNLAPRPPQSFERPISPLTRSTVLTPASTPSFVQQATSRDSLDHLDFSGLGLICPIDSTAISTRWLNSYVPLPEQVAKNYPPAIIAFIRRMLKSYASIAIHGRGIPPFVHPVQLNILHLSSPLTDCLNLVRTCDGSFSANLDSTIEIVKWKMGSLYGNRETQTEIELLATFQAGLIYCLVLHFSGSQDSAQQTFLRDSMLQLQELACICAQQGVVCLAEQQQVRPKWESWILCEAKRRTLYVTYMFDSLLLAEDNLPSFLASELQGLPAPASRKLWYSNRRKEWEKAYNVHLTDWTTGGLKIEELWPHPIDLDDARREEKRARVDSWLEDLDEFGVMLFTVTSFTHGT